MGLDEEKIQAALRNHRGEQFTPVEKAALDYAELLARDEKRIGEETYAALRRHLSEGELVELGVLVALCVGFDKLISTWGLEAESCGLEWLHEA